ncbi:MAG TPA: hypothetical protein VGU69_05420 [Rhizomicrobium sp.]|nr:hypothetical protein [Rhizomicrobium sp.]
MKNTFCALVAFLAVVAPSWAADDPTIERLALCRDSWVDWSKSNPAQMDALRNSIMAGYTQRQGDPFYVPKTAKSFAGYKVIQLFPGNVGMGVGFSIVVDGTFGKVQQSVEKMLGKPLKDCSTSDGMHSCELDIADQRTVTLMAGDDPKSSKTLVGCYYFYEK